MISLNLLSPAKKKKLKERLTLHLLKNISYIVVIFIVFMVGILLGTKFILERKLTNIENEVNQTILTLPTGEEVPLSSTIQEINKKIKFFEGIQKDCIKWSNYLADFTELIPENITLTQLSLNQESEEIQINGLALLRDDFLRFKNNLENSQILTELVSPVSNLIKREDVNFTLSGKMVLDNYKL